MYSIVDVTGVYKCYGVTIRDDGTYFLVFSYNGEDKKYVDSWVWLPANQFRPLDFFVDDTGAPFEVVNKKALS